MGPRHEDRGERRAAGDDRRPAVRLQWGHGTKTVENRARSDAISVGAVRFNGATARRPWRTSQAWSSDPDCRSASMGPRHKTVENSTTRVIALASVQSLQWGHGTKTVENIDQLRSCAATQPALQWGHGTKTVENVSETRATGRQRCSASMGPRHKDRGEPLPKYHHERLPG